MSTPIRPQHSPFTIHQALQDLRKIGSQIADHKAGHLSKSPSDIPERLPLISQTLAPLQDPYVNKNIKIAEDWCAFFFQKPTSGNTSPQLCAARAYAVASLTFPSFSSQRPFPSTEGLKQTYPSGEQPSCSSSSQSKSVSSTLSSSSSASALPSSVAIVASSPPLLSRIGDGSSSSSASVMPAKIAIIFDKFLQKGNPSRLTILDQEKIYKFYLSSVTSITEPSVLDEKATRLARTLLLGPKKGYVCMSHEEDPPINNGSFKKVYHAAGLHDGKHYAVGECDYEHAGKVANVSPEYVRQLCYREKSICESLSGLHGIVQMRFTAEVATKFYFVMDFLEGGDLFDLQKMLEEKTRSLPIYNRLNIGRQLLTVLAAMHDRGINHRDLKPENILLDEKGNAFLCDFGLALRSTDQCDPRYHLGTLDFWAPEMFHGKAPNSKTDVWAIGLIIYNLLTFYYFKWQTMSDHPEMIQWNIPQSALWKASFPKLEDSLPPSQQADLEQLIKDMLHVNPLKRLTAQRALATLEKILAEVPVVKAKRPKAS